MAEPLGQKANPERGANLFLHYPDKSLEESFRYLALPRRSATDEPSTLILAQATKFSCVPLRIPPCPQRFHFYRKGAEGCLQGAKEFPSSPSCCTFSPSWLVFFNRRGNRGFAEDAEDDVSVSFNNPLLIRFIFAFVKIPFIDSRNDKFHYFTISLFHYFTISLFHYFAISLLFHWGLASSNRDSPLART